MPKLTRLTYSHGFYFFLLADKLVRIEDYLHFVKEGIKLDLEEYDPFENKNKKEIRGSAVFVTHRKVIKFRLL